MLVVLMNSFCTPGNKYARSSRPRQKKNVQQEKDRYTSDNFSWDESARDDNNQNEYFDDYLEESSEYAEKKRRSSYRSRNVRERHQYRTKRVTVDNSRRKTYRKSKQAPEVRKKKSWIREEGKRPKPARKYRAKKRKDRQRAKTSRIRSYRVRKGDSLFSIARKFNISLSKLRKANSIKGSRIRIGKKLKIPSRGKNKTTRKAVAKKTRKIYNNPGFIWPIRNIYKIKRDGQDGVKAIGVFIVSKTGASVRAAASGVIKKIGEMRGYGKYIVVQHSNRYISVYSNLKEIKVSEGQRINQGRVIGKLRSDSNKLHFQINCAGKAQDPRHLVKNKS